MEEAEPSYHFDFARKYTSSNVGYLYLFMELLNTKRVSNWKILRVIRRYYLEKKVKNPSLSSHFNRSPHSLRYGRRRKARASPRRGGELRNSVIRALGGSRANTLAVASPLGESPNYVVLPRGGGRRPPRAASHRTCMGGPFLFWECVRHKIPKCFVVVHLSTSKLNTVGFLPVRNSLCVKYCGY